MIDIILASNNKGKIVELKKILGEYQYNLLSLKEAGIDIEVVEDGSTFQENAEKKAREIAAITGKITISDDSGLCVDVLGGKPGVFSARYAGENATDADRIEKLLSELRGEGHRSAKFVCCIALAENKDNIKTFIGECAGSIAESVSGNGGFGYDPIFIPDGYDVTFGELSSDEKNRISHRANALKKLSEYFKEISEGRHGNTCNK